MKSILLVVVFFLYNVAFAQNAGELDMSFDPGTGTNTLVEAIAVQDDGKILIGGPFSEYNGTTINGIARLNPDGSLDNSFNPGDGIAGIVTGQQYHVYDIAIQDDGKIILVGGFYYFDNVDRKRIVRLNTDGSIDLTFDPGDGADGNIRTIDLQDDGKMVIGGNLTYYNGFPNAAPFIARINSDGTQDNSFDPGTGANSAIQDLAIQDDGKIVIVGDFSEFNGTPYGRVARLNNDGTVDGSFDSGSGTGGIFPSVRSVNIQTDGKIVISGYFGSYDGNNIGQIARIESDGAFDASFDPGTPAGNAIHKVEILPSDDFIVVGSFYSYDGTSRNSIARINSDGSLDTQFDPGNACNNTGEALAVQSDGKVLIGGNFTQYDGTARNYIARVHNEATSGLQDLQSSILDVYPNPSNGIFYLPDENEYTLLNNAGKTILEGEGSYLDLRTVSSGIYFLQLPNGQKIKLIKL